MKSKQEKKYIYVLKDLLSIRMITDIRILILKLRKLYFRLLLFRFLYG